MFRPPVNRAMHVLDRSFFKKRIPLAAAKVLDSREIAKCQNLLKPDLLNLDRLANVRLDPEANSTGKLLLLKPEVKAEGMSLTNSLKLEADMLSDSTTWGGKLRDLIGQKTVVVAPYNLDLDYSYWTYRMYV